MNTRIVTLFLILAFRCAVCAQQRAALDVSLLTLEHTPTNTVATIHIQNNSGKDVSAFNIALTQTYASGEVSSSMSHTLDLGYRATKDGDEKHNLPKLLVAGQSTDLVWTLEKDVVQAVPSLGAVVYVDRTAEGDPDVIHDITVSRQKIAEGLVKDDPKHAAAAAQFAKDDLRCGKVLCSTLRRQP